MLKGTTESGFTYEMEDDALDDFELLEDLRAMERGDTGMAIDLVYRLLGKGQTEKLKEHVRTVKGRVSAKRMLEEFSQILAANTETKN